MRSPFGAFVGSRAVVQVAADTFGGVVQSAGRGVVVLRDCVTLSGPSATPLDGVLIVPVGSVTWMQAV